MEEDQQQTTPTKSGMNPMMLIAGVVGLLLIGGVAWMLLSNNSSSNSTNTQTVPPTQTENNFMEPKATGMESAVKEFTVEGSNFKFTPKALTVKEGDSVKIIFKNVEGLHDFVIDELNVATKQIKGEEEETIEFIASKAGTYEYYCSIGKHREMGMKGTLTVEPKAKSGT